MGSELTIHRTFVVVVCGSRSWRDEKAIRERLRQLPQGSTVIHGAARGADVIAGKVAKELGLRVIECPADWSQGRSAGYKRNREMIEKYRPDFVLAFWDGKSRGTQHTMRLAEDRGIDLIMIRGD